MRVLTTCSLWYTDDFAGKIYNKNRQIWTPVQTPFVSYFLGERE